MNTNNFSNFEGEGLEFFVSCRRGNYEVQIFIDKLVEQHVFILTRNAASSDKFGTLEVSKQQPLVMYSVNTEDICEMDRDSLNQLLHDLFDQYIYDEDYSAPTE